MRRYRFNYGYYGTPSAFPDYVAHRGCVVEILHEIPTDPEVGTMYHVRAEDGWEGDALPDELVPLEDIE